MKRQNFSLDPETKRQLDELALGNQSAVVRRLIRQAHTLGPAARAALSLLALQDAVACGVEQDTAAAALLARLIEAERQRRINDNR